MAKIPVRHLKVRDHQNDLFAYHLPIRVYFENTDAGQVVYHSEYIKFLERARTEWLRHLGFVHGNLQTENDIVFVVSELSLQFSKPARLDDLLAVTVRLVELSKVRAVFEQAISRDDDLLVSARVTIACVSAGGLKPKAIPADVAAKMNATLG